MQMLWPLPLLMEVADGAGGDGSVDRADECVVGGLPEATEPTFVTVVTVVKMLCLLALLLSVSTEAGWRRQTDWRWLTATEVTELLRELTDVSEVDCQTRQS